MDIDDIASIKTSMINRKIVNTRPFNPVFLILLAEKSLALNGHIFVGLTNKKLLLTL